MRINNSSKLRLKERELHVQMFVRKHLDCCTPRALLMELFILQIVCQANVRDVSIVDQPKVISMFILLIMFLKSTDNIKL